MYNINEKNKKLLEEALAKLGIKAPESYNFDMDGYMTWGNFDRSWIKIFGHFIIFGNYDAKISNFISNIALTDTYKNLISEEIKRIEEAFSEHDEFVSTEVTNVFPKLKKSDINHPYLLRNQVEAYDLKQSERTLVFAVHDTNGKIWNFYCIDENGKGKYVQDGKKHACYFAIGKLKNKKIFVCDNYVAGAKIHEKTGESVAIAFDQENLEPVKKALLAKHPDYEITIVSGVDIKEIAPSAETNEAMDVFDQYNTDICTSDSENSQEKCDSDNLTEQVETKPAKEDVEPETNTTLSKQNNFNGFFLKDDGLFKMDDEKENKSHRVSDQIEVLAELRDDESDNWGKVVKFKDPDGVIKTIVIPYDQFGANTKELEVTLRSKGLRIDKFNELKQHLITSVTENRVRGIDKIGWYKETFVFSDGTVIGNTDENIMYYGNNNLNAFHTKGSLEDWRKNISKYCQGNSRLILAVSTAFAGPLVYITGQESGGLHFVGNSSTGKSTILRVACSVYGDKNFMKTWRATDNGLEGIAATRNDTLLILDELGQVDPNKAGESIYMLGNGDGKIRSNRNGSAKKNNTWRCLYLSSGEKDLSDCAIESKKMVKAGQAVRFLSIPAKPSENSYGAFETVHDKDSGKAFSEYLNEVVKNYHGTAAREFIHCVVNDGFEKIDSDFKDFLSNAEQEYLPNDADNQVRRAFNRFMLIAFAGEYATANNITGWSKNDSLNGCIKCFNDWIKRRGGVKDQEPQLLLEQVRRFFEQHHSSRFYTVFGNNYDESKTYNMVGLAIKEDDDKCTYYVYSQSFKEICTGYDLEFARNTLYNAGWIENKEPKQIGKRNMLRGKRFYIFTSKVWDDETVE